ncbi:MAG: hypothetical protein FWF00_05765 [Endomicrobia bacterium]|nr:hypothetical protein [Endomicrobiia bacterium]MCL2507175.1 hypothetical protein [Endomicrobiia bacterium]
MKRIVFILPLFLICAFIIISCAPEKKSRLNNNTITVKIEPPVITNLPIGNTITLTAIVRNAGGNIQELPVSWSISDPSFGEFSTVNGRTTEFTATGNGIAVITAICNGVIASINAGCGNAQAPDSIVLSGVPAGLSNGKTANTITARLYSEGAELINVSPVVWTISGPGSLDKTSTTSGELITLTADPLPAFGQVSITASFGNLSATVRVSVAEVVPTANAVMIYSDNSFGPNLIHDYFIWGDWQRYPDWGNYPSQPPNYPTTSELLLNANFPGGAKVDPNISIEMIYKAGNWTAGPWGGFSYNYESAQPLTAMTKLYFYVRGEKGGESLILQYAGNAATNVNVNTIKPITTSWQLYTVTVNSALLGSVTVPVSFFFESASDNTVYIDYIYFDTE